MIKRLTYIFNENDDIILIIIRNLVPHLIAMNWNQVIEKFYSWSFVRDSNSLLQNDIFSETDMKK